MRLIDAEALKKALQSEQNNMQPLSDTNYYIGVKQGLKLAEAIIDTAPTVEERPQVVIFSENMTAEEKQKLIAEFKAVMDNAKFTIEPERPQGECKSCRHRDPEDKKCDCGGQERQGCPFPVSDNYYCKYYEKGGAE